MPFLLTLLVTGFAVGHAFQQMQIRHANDAFYAKLERLMDKSEAHQMVLENMLKCLRDDGLPEATCITNTILLAEVNGYKNEVARVFNDAGIPRK